jgi:two-component system NtrC family sensor kinase
LAARCLRACTLQVDPDNVDTHLAERRLADRLAIVGTLLPAIAQELGTPLGVVLARARLIETGALSPVDEARAGGIIAEQVGRMSQVIRRLLDFSGARPGETANGQEQVWVSLRALVDDITEMLRPVAHRRQITLRLRIGPPILVRADGCLLQQALVNLMIKLIQEMRGPGEVHLTLGRRQATPPSLRQGDLRRPYAQFSAYGRPGSLSPESWEAFSGLTVPRGIISEQGGWLLLSRTNQRGPGFTVYLPLHAS